MKRNNSQLFALALIGALIMSACNSSEDSVYEGDPLDLSGVAVTGFSLQANAGVLNNLDSVFFSIDLNNARIFNADSLPYGTDVSALAVSLTTDACSQVKLFAPGDEGEVEIDYLSDESAKVDFSKGAVRLHLVSYDQSRTRDYTIEVNVHCVVPDSLYWSELARTELPTSLQSPTIQKTVKVDGMAYCLSFDGTDYCLAVSANPYDGEWQLGNVAFPKPVQVRTLTATTTTFYILADDGELLQSTDAGSWHGTGEYWRSIIAPYDEVKVLGLKMAGAQCVHVSYPASDETVAVADFPVEGSSSAVKFATKWASSPQLVLLGGRKADGSLSGATWAYDGSGWAKIGDGMKAAEGYAVAGYTICETDTVSWRVKESDVLLAFGGRADDGIGNDVFFSRDMGLTWKKGDTFLQLPDYMPSVYGADLLVFNHTMNARSGATSAQALCWHEMPVRTLPSIYAMPASRVSTLSGEWECPFLYMFGGVDSNGDLQNAVWRGVVNHFTFRPLE